MFTKKEYARIFSKISIDTNTQCWNWTGYLSGGYGRVYWRGKRYKAHRLIYQWKYGNLPDWENYSSPEMDHICRNRACVNPDHLRIVSKKENILIGNGPTAINSKKEFCKHGHILITVGDRRKCKECNRLYMSSQKRREYKRKYYNEHYKRK